MFSATTAHYCSRSHGRRPHDHDQKAEAIAFCMYLYETLFGFSPCLMTCEVVACQSRNAPWGPLRSTAVSAASETGEPLSSARTRIPLGESTAAKDKIVGATSGRWQ